MAKRLTVEEVKQRLGDRPIEIIGEYVRMGAPVELQCLVSGCGHKWLTSMDCILNGGHGCAACKNKLKLTNDIVDKRLKNNNLKFKRLGNVVNDSAKILFKCLYENCNYEWEASPGRISRGERGCPNRKRHTKLTNEVIDERLGNRPIKRLGNHIESDMLIKYQCLICNYIWESTTDSILNHNNGCSSCAGNTKLDNATIDKKLLENKPHIIRIDDYINSETLIKYRCTKDGCGYEWYTKHNAILNAVFACPNCAGNAPLNNKIIDQRLEYKNIKRLDDYISLSIPIRWQCTIPTCNYIWISKPSDVANAGHGCPKCNLGKNEKLIGEIFKDYDIKFESQKYISHLDCTESRLLHVDFYLQYYNLIIEYNGHQHYGPIRFDGQTKEKAAEKFVRQQERDKYLQNFCDKNNIKLIWINGIKYYNKTLKEYVINELVPKLLGLIHE